ncbi:MAG TPA: glycosyltransferase family 2 protein [Lacisediminihabitans sp.]|uniref:glycosyltransferase n=1 Tax=Lacisediminihabitans sp. TaxID=2787631 RepID=UPI002ED87590
MTINLIHRPSRLDPFVPGLPTVSIVIPAYNEQDTIGRCLAAALHQTVPALEIIVVDNLSTDATTEVVTRIAAAHPGRGIRLVRQNLVQGLVPTRNAGFAAATGEVLGRIDADTMIDPDWVERVSKRMLIDDAGAVTGPVSYYDVPLAGAGHLADDLTRRFLRRLGSEYPFLYGSNMAIRASAWRAIEHNTCLDPDDRQHEDIDVAVHLYEAGIVAAYDPRMRAGVSARRMDSAPSDFQEYTRRFGRTYDDHGISRWYLGVPQLLLRGIYWPVHLGRSWFASTRSTPREVSFA